MTPLSLTRAALAAGLLVTVATAATGQPIAQRIERISEGDVRFTFPLRPDVCGSGQNIWYRGGNHQMNWGDRQRSRDVEYDVDCQSGPGRIVVVRRESEVAELRFYVGGRWRQSTTATDLGAVSARAAADYLTSLASTNDRKAGREAIFPLTLVDSVVIWPSLMRIARDDQRPRETRKNAVFWLGQIAEEPATAGLSEIVGERDIDREVREQAVFALSQRRDEGVPALIRIVRTNKDPELRRKALFWLAQSGDPRALDLIEELLAKK
jgi:hypothetical protein